MRALGPVTSSAALASPAAAMSGVVCRTAGDAPARLSPAISTLRATETTTLVALVRPAFALPVPDLRSELRVDFDPDGRKSRVRRNTFRLPTKKGAPNGAPSCFSPLPLWTELNLVNLRTNLGEVNRDAACNQIYAGDRNPPRRGVGTVAGDKLPRVCSLISLLTR